MSLTVKRGLWDIALRVQCNHPCLWLMESYKNTKSTKIKNTKILKKYKNTKRVAGRCTESPIEPPLRLINRTVWKEPSAGYTMEIDINSPSTIFCHKKYCRVYIQWKYTSIPSTVFCHIWLPSKIPWKYTSFLLHHVLVIWLPPKIKKWLFFLIRAQNWFNLGTNKN